MEKINCIYQGCFTKNEDGTNRIIANNKACLFPTDKQFGKYPEDVPSEVKTRSQCKKKKKKLITKRVYDRYFTQKRGTIFEDG